MEKKRILHVYSSWTAGGAEKLMLSLAEGLEKKGVKNFIACPKTSYMFKKAEELGLKAYPVVIKGSFDPIGIFKLWNIVNKEKIDIIHAHQGKVFWPCVFIKWLSRKHIKIVFHRHAQLAHKFYSRWHYSFADKVIAISSAVAQGLIEREKVSSDKIKVIYNGTNFSRFNKNVSGEEVRKRYGLVDKFVIGTAAAMNKPKGKGQEYLIEAAQILKRRFPNAVYLIAGTGPIENDLKSLAVKLGVSDRVIFTGYQEEIEKYIAAMDIFCFLSWDTEGFGQVMVEAQIMGKPVIGTNIGGIPETFKDGVTGYLIPPKDSEILAQVLSQLIDDNNMMATMSAEAIKFAESNFNLDLMAERVNEIYKEIGKYE